MDQRKVMDGLMPRIAVGVMSLLTVAVLLLAVFNERGMLSVNKRERDLQEVLQKNEQLEREQRKLEWELREYETNPLIIEKKAREELELARPDEIIIEIPESDSAPALSK